MVREILNLFDFSCGMACVAMCHSSFNRIEVSIAFDPFSETDRTKMAFEHCSMKGVAKQLGEVNTRLFHWEVTAMICRP